MSITHRVRELGLPLNQVVVIGSGVLDALSLREADDIDLAVSDRLFSSLKRSGKFELSVRHGQEVLERGAAEIWQDWGSGRAMSFEVLYTNGIEIDGVRFCHPQTVLAWKRNMYRDKDVDDIALLEAYLKVPAT